MSLDATVAVAVLVAVLWLWGHGQERRATRAEARVDALTRNRDRRLP